VSLDYVIAVEIGHLSVALHPYLVPAVFGEIVKAGDVESKFATLCELSNQHACGEQFFLGDVGGHVRDETVDIVNAIFDKPKD
jgi:hypothetical protein